MTAANSSDVEIYDVEEFTKSDAMAATSSACTADDDNVTGHSEVTYKNLVTFT